MSYEYRPELDAIVELDATYISMFQEFIEDLKWYTDIGRVDILHEVSVLSAFQASPRE